MLKPIRNKSDYKKYLARTYELIQKDLKYNSDEYNELEILSILLEHYEMENFPITAPDPVDAIKFRLEQMNEDKSRLIEILGSKSRVSEILNRKRTLSLSMIRALHKELKIPASALISKSKYDE